MPNKHSTALVATRNLHATIDPDIQRLLRAQAALEGVRISQVIESAILAYCGRLAAANADQNWSR
jgi:hypothetical protein